MTARPYYHQPLQTLLNHDSSVHLKDPIIIRGNGHVTVFGLSSNYPSEFPSSLTSRVAPEEFKSTMEKINSVLKKRVIRNLAWCGVGCLLCCCTLGTSLCPAVYSNKKTQAKIKNILEEENARLYNRIGLNWRFDKKQNGTLIDCVIIVEYLPKNVIYKPE